MSVAVMVVAVVVALAPVAAWAALRRRRVLITRSNEAAVSRLVSGRSTMARECPACGQVFAEFDPGESEEPADERCVGCGSLPGDRLLALYTLNETDLLSGTERRRVLHLGWRTSWAGEDAAGRVEHVSADPATPADGGAPPLAPASFDAIYTAAAPAADGELRAAELHRLLAPGGWAVVLSPAPPEPPPAADVSPGADQAERLAATGLQVTVDPYPRRISSACAARFGLRPGDVLLFCRKPLAGAPGYVERLWTGAPDRTDPQSVPGARPVTTGRVEEVRDGVVFGWVWNPDQPGEPVLVRVVIDGQRVAGGLANLERPSLAWAGIGGGWHVFRVQLPAWVASAATRRLRVEPEDGVALPSASGFTSTAPNQREVWGGTEFAAEGYSFGRVEVVQDGVVSGWVWSPEAPSWTLGVRVMVDGEPVASGLAELPREGLDGAGADTGRRRFRIRLPEPIPAGIHTLRVEIDERRPGKPGAAKRPVALLPSVTFTTAVESQPAAWDELDVVVESSVFGRVESFHDGAVSGWAWDRAGPRRRVGLRIIVDGHHIGRVVADRAHAGLTRSGVGDGCHGFRFELPVKMASFGRHSLRIEAEDGSPLPGCAGFGVAGADALSSTHGHVSSAGSVVGRIERIHNGTVIGWAWDPGAPGARIGVRVLLDDREVAAAVADRQPAAPARGDGRREFWVSLPAVPPGPGPHRLRVEADGGLPLMPSAGFATVVDDRADGWRGVDFTVEGAVLGCVEEVCDGVVSGWAWRPHAPQWRVWVRVLLDGKEVAAGIADLDQPSLAAAGVGDGRHGFRFSLPEPPRRGSHRLRVDAEDVSLPAAEGFRVRSERDPRAWRLVAFVVDGARAGEPGPPVVGAIDGVRDGVMSGWAWSPAEPGWRLWVRLIVDGEEACGAFAELDRPDLAELGIGDGRHGFSLELAPVRPGTGPPQVRVEAALQVTLPAGPRFAADGEDRWQIIVCPGFRGSTGVVVEQ